jgi:hypothetical protein
MPLLSVWASNPSAVGEFTIEQVVATAGDGVLKDGSPCSQELREYFAQIPSRKISEYVDHCLEAAFNKSGVVLQDLINEIGRRLDYKATNGRYQGSAGKIGFDGIWLSPEGHSIVLEVKTTDAYRISLDTIAEYRKKLIDQGLISSKSSILIVVGRDDTGELEAQVRGSRHAWDIRLISTDALLKLVRLKESSEELETGSKIRSLLTPMEYTRLDEMVDVMFTTAADIESASDEISRDEEDEEIGATGVPQADLPKRVWQFTDGTLLQDQRGKIVATLEKKIGSKLINKSRALYWDAGHKIRAACTISKHYTRHKHYSYWYAYHPQWDDFLREGDPSFFVLGCMDVPAAFAIPWKIIHSVLPDLNTTTTSRSTYWHIHVAEPKPNSYALLLPKRSTQLPLDEHRINLLAT